MVTASDRSAVSFSLAGGAKHDSPEGMKLLFFTPACRIGQSLLIDRAYEGDKMRAVAKKLGYNPVVPPKKNRIDPWEYDRILYKRRNEVERFFRRIKRFRRVFTRYDKLDIVFAGFILFAMIFDFLRQYRTNELVRRRMNFSSDAMADFEGLLEVNRKICKQQMAEKASPTLPTNCAVLPLI